MKLNPLNDRIVIEPIKWEDKTKGGLYLPETAQDKPQTGKVIAVGPGLYQDGELINPSCKAGDTVLFAKYSGTEIKLDDKKVLIMRESDILAIVAS